MSCRAFKRHEVRLCDPTAAATSRAPDHSHRQNGGCGHPVESGTEGSLTCYRLAAAGRCKETAGASSAGQADGALGAVLTAAPVVSIRPGVQPRAPDLRKREGCDSKSLQRRIDLCVNQQSSRRGEHNERAGAPANQTAGCCSRVKRHRLHHRSNPSKRRIPSQGWIYVRNGSPSTVASRRRVTPSTAGPLSTIARNSHSS